MGISALGRNLLDSDEATANSIADSLRLLFTPLNHVEEADGYWHAFIAGMVTKLKEWDEKQFLPESFPRLRVDTGEQQQVGWIEDSPDDEIDVESLRTVSRTMQLSKINKSTHLSPSGTASCKSTTNLSSRQRFLS